jgi:hypothetical protein
VILDTDGNIFGGFTPVVWDDNSWEQSDPSRESFLFTLKNPRNVPPRRFALSSTTEVPAIYCRSDWGPSFNDIGVKGNCDRNTDSYTSFFGSHYTADSVLNADVFFTGAKDFRVEEIEVFEITA